MIDCPHSIYIFDKQRGLEQWGLYVVEETEGDKETKTIEIKHEHPLGYVFTEFISLDYRALESIAVEAMMSDNQINACDVMDTLSLVDVDNEELLEASNSVATLSAFIDICNDNPAMFSNIWFEALVEITDGYRDFFGVVDLVNGPIDNWMTWEEYNPLMAFDNIDMPSALYKPEENSILLLGALQKRLKINTGHGGGTLAVCSYSTITNCLFLSLENLITEDVLPKKCPNCGKYFIPQKRSDAIYCDRKAPQDGTKTCKEYGARAAWANTLRNNEAAGLYRNIYMAKQMAAKRNPDRVTDFQWFKAESKRWKSNVKSGANTEDEYIAWLKSVKEKKVL